MLEQNQEREVSLSSPQQLDSIEQRLELDIKRLQLLLSRISKDASSLTRAETQRVYSQMLEAREDLLNQIQLQRLSREIEARAIV